jgi:Right handed beta helix region
MEKDLAMPRRLIRAMAALALLVAALPAAAATLEVGEGKQYATPSAAAAVAKDGDHVVIAVGEYFDCAVWRANNLVIEGVSAEKTVITDKTCGGKALFVIDGNAITVRKLTLARARVPDFNGAGIRAEGGDLTVEHVRFINNQNGILSSANPNATILIRDSEFSRNGTCEGGGCAHGLYIGPAKLLRVERSKFSETKQGHHIKSRAARTEIIDCDISDGPKGSASYSIDVPNGGAVVVRGTKIEKGPNSENHSAAIEIGEEGVTQHTQEITIQNNEFQVDGDYNSFLVNNMTATDAELKGNKLSENAKPLHGDGDVQ